MDKQHISQEDIFVWLSRGGLKGETGSEIIAAKIRHYKPNIMRKSFTNRNVQQMQTLGTTLLNSETHHISMPNIGK
jgi:hypothetical protein